MTPLDTLFSSDVLGALVIVTLGVFVEPVIAHRMDGAFAGNHAFHWSWDYFFEPLTRTLLVFSFVLIAYPALFGARDAPAIGQLVAEQEHALGNLFGILFALSLFMPASGFFQRHSGAILPFQALLATAMVFSWYTDYLGIASASPWPGIHAAGAIPLMAYLAHRIAHETGVVLGSRVDELFSATGYNRLIPNALAALLQLPVVVYYGLILGRQISI